MKNYLIKNHDSYFIEGSEMHNVYTFDKKQAARFTDFGAELKVLQIHNWRNDRLEVVKIK